MITRQMLVINDSNELLVPRGNRLADTVRIVFLNEVDAVRHFDRL